MLQQFIKLLLQNIKTLQKYNNSNIDSWVKKSLEYYVQCRLQIQFLSTVPTAHVIHLLSRVSLHTAVFIVYTNHVPSYLRKDQTSVYLQ